MIVSELFVLVFCVYIFVCIAYICVCACGCACMHIYVCIYAYVYMCVYMQVCAYMCIYMYVHVCIYMYVCMGSLNIFAYLVIENLLEAKVLSYVVLLSVPLVTYSKSQSQKY